jgi:hypothetical protein
MTKILRWHVARIYREKKPKGYDSPMVEVTINPEVEDGSGQSSRKELISISEEKSDDLDRWDLDESRQIEGWVPENQWIDIIGERHASEKTLGLEKILEERRLVEDMVLLQIIKNGDQVLLKIYEELQKNEGHCNLEELMKMNNSSWLDFTQQAREMAKAVYRKAMGAEEVKKDESES